MKKRLFLLTLLVFLAGAFILSSCHLNDYDVDNDDVSYTLNGELPSVATFGEELDLSSLSITKTTNGSSTTVPVTRNMITSGNTNQIGMNVITFSYEGYTFSRTVNVKYQVIFKDGDKIVKAQYATDASEIAPPTIEAKNGLVFKGWSPVIADKISSNVTYSAIFEDAAPDLSEFKNITKEYGTKLSEIKLPADSNGSWQFNDTPETTVGNAGETYNFGVSYIQSDGSVAKTDTVSISVTKKVLEFKNLVTEFTYNGKQQIPTFDFGGIELNPNNVLFSQDGTSDYTSAGTYNYEFFIFDPNYEGEISGTYEIKKADITVFVNSYTISILDDVPNAEYTVEGFDNNDLSPLGLSVIKPNVTEAGTYTISVSSSNTQSINLTVNPGTLTVTAVSLNINDIGYPTIIKDGIEYNFNDEGTRISGIQATFEDTFSDYEFKYNPVGRWQWDVKNTSERVGDASDTPYTYKVTFIPNDDRYNPISTDITVKVKKKTLYFHFSDEEEVYYDGTEKGITYEIYENPFGAADKGKKYEGLTIEGYTKHKNAGSHPVSLSINDPNYEAAGGVTTFVINKIDPPEAEYDFSDVVFEAVWSNSLTLANFNLPDGCTWIDAGIKPEISENGKEYEAIYTPKDTVNYNTKEIEFTVKVSHAVGTLSDLLDSYEVEYNGSVFSITDIAATLKLSHGEKSDLEITYKQNDTPAIPKNAGEYSVTIKLPKNEHYTEATATTTLIVKKATNTDEMPVYNTTYGSTLSDIALPESTNGSWTWVLQGTTVVGNVGSNTFEAKYTDESGNYLDRTATVTVNVTKATNSWTSAPSATKSEWDYLDTAAAFSATAKFGGNASVTFTKDRITYTDSVPTDAGSYEAYFSVEGTSNYVGISGYVSFTINKKEISIPDAKDKTYSFTYTGSEIELEFEASTLYTVSGNKQTAVGSYKATLTLSAPKNYKWETSDAASVTVDYAITKAKAEITNLTLNGWTFGTSANEPTASTSFGTVSYTYYKGSEKLSAKPTAAGTYIVKATVAGTSNYDSDEEEATFVIAKADPTITANSTYTFTYNGAAVTVSGITDNNPDADVTITYNGEALNLTDAGSYDVKVSLAETANFNAKDITVKVVINKAENTDEVKLTQSATYTDTLSTLELPENENGSWAWVLADTTAVGSVGSHTFEAKYTDESGNYLDRTVTVTVNVSKKTVPVPTVKDNVKSFTYTGSEITLEFVDANYASLYTISGNKQINVGNYTAYLKLNDSANYAWKDVSGDTVPVEYHVTIATNSWTSAPSATKSEWDYLDTAAAFSATAKFGGNASVTFTKDRITYTDSVPTDAGSYEAYFSVEGTSNYVGISGYVSFTINKKEISIPDAKDKTYSFTYTGSEIELEFEASTLYTVSGNKQTAVGSYKATLTLSAPKNYKWETSDAASVTVDYAITKAKAEITNLTLNGWTFGTSANEPTASTSFGTVSYTYYKGSEKLSAKPTAAGTYIVKATVAGTSNYDSDEEEATFVIAKADPTITANSTYTFTYNGAAVTVSGITDNNPDADVTITYNGEALNLTDAGSYDVKVSLAETANFNAKDITVKVVINKAENTDEVKLTQSATYTDTLSTLELPENENGSWAWVLADTTAVGSVGSHTFEAKYTDESGNYLDRTVTVTVNVSKKTVPVPTISDKVYDGNLYVPTIDTTSGLYTVSENNGGTDMGQYRVILKLSDNTNYKWETTENESITINYNIAAAVNSWTIEPSISASWEYKGAPTVTAEAKYGYVRVEYAPEGSDDFSETVPTDAGSYIVRFTTTDTNYTVLTVEKSVTIKPKSVIRPTLSATELTYTGLDQHPSVTHKDDEALYTITYEESITVGSYNVVISLKNSSNYEWDNKTTANLSLPYSITKADAGLTATLEGWTYGTSANEPDYEADFTITGVYFLYAGSDGVYSATVPNLAGTYTVKAVYDGDSNIDVSESAPVEFAIAKAGASIGGYTESKSYEIEYNGSVYEIPGITDTNPEAAVTYSYVKDGEGATEIKGAGAYTVTISLAESNNYEAAESVTVTVVVKKQENKETISTLGTDGSVTYGDTLSTVTLPTSATGTWSWKTSTNKVGNATATGNDHTAVFTPFDTANYASRELLVKVAVSKKVLAAPTVPEANRSQTYTGSPLSVGIPDVEGEYTVSGGSATDFGTHTVTITLENPKNYAWTSVDNESATVSVTFNITQATNSWKTSPSLSKNEWTYLGDAATHNAKAEFGSYGVKYTSDGGLTYSDTMPTAAGTYTAVFYVTATSNYTGLEETKTFTIKPKSVIRPTLSATELTYTGLDQHPSVTHKDDEALYTITYEESITVGSYNVVISLKNSSNYEWDNKTTANLSLPYSITKADAGLTATLEGWTYGTSANEPDYEADFTITGVYFLYAGSDGVYSATVPNLAGTYTVKAVYDGDSNIDVSESAPVEFAIAKAGASIGGYTESKSYEIEYNGSVYEIPGITDTNPEAAVTYSYVKDGEGATEIKGAGAYTVTISLAESNNYEAAESVTVTVVVKKQENKETISTLGTDGSVTYGDTLSTVTLPTSATGTWSWKTSTNKVGNATATGNDHTAVFTPFDTANYASRELLVKVAVKKATNVWSEEPSLSKLTWIYGEAAATVSNGTAAFGEISVSYLKDKTTSATALPTVAGTHSVVFTVTGNDNYTSLTKTIEYTVNKKTYTAPSLDKSTFVYNGNVQAPTVAKDDSLYTITYSNASSTNVNSYTVTLELKDTLNNVWSDGTTKVVRTYTITKGQASITGFTTEGWIYKQYTAPTATTNLGTVVFTYYDKDGNVLDAIPETAGTYKVSASVAETSNYYGTETLPIDFNISQATPELSGYDAVASATYQNKVVLSTTGLSAKHADESVAGTFAYGSIVFAESTTANPKASYVELTFTPTDTHNYKVTTVKVTMALKTVAKVNNQTPYGTIENALNAAASGNTVWVVPDTTGNVVIKENVTVKSGVTLILAFGTDDSGRNVPNSDGKIPATLTDDGDGNSTNRINGISLLEAKSIVTLASEVVITNYGKIELSGEIGAPGGGVYYTGHTARYYAELRMEKDSKIVSKQGSSILCCGFIYETVLDNGSSVTLENGASLAQPFTMRDYRGGSYMAAVYYKLSDGYSPFNMYQFKNVTAKLVINYGGALNALVNIYASSSINSETVTMVGPGANAIIQLNTANSYLTSKLNPNTEICKLDIFGGAATNGMKISVDAGITVGIDTSKSYFPVPYYYDITLHTNNGSGKYYMNQPFKFLTGSKLTVSEGVTLNAKTLIFYEDFTDPCTIPGTYPTGLAAAEFNVYGTVILGEFGGILTARSDNAKVIITKAFKATAYEVVSISGSSILSSIGDKQEKTYTAKFRYMTESTLMDISGESYGLGGYAIENSAWKKLTYAFVSWSDGFDRIVVNAPIYDSNFQLIETSGEFYDSAVDGRIDFFFIEDGKTATITLKDRYGFFINGTLYVNGTAKTSYSLSDVANGNLPSGGGTVTWTANSAQYIVSAYLPKIGNLDYGSLSFSSSSIVYCDNGTLKLSVKYTRKTSWGQPEDKRVVISDSTNYEESFLLSIGDQSDNGKLIIGKEYYSSAELLIDEDVDTIYIRVVDSSAVT